MVRIPGNAPSGLCYLKLGAALGHSQRIDRNLSGFAMDLQLKPVFEKRLQHGPPHDVPAWNSLRFRIDAVTGGIDPGRPSRDWDMPPRRLQFAIRVLNVRHLDEIHYSPASQIQASRRRASVTTAL